MLLRFIIVVSVLFVCAVVYAGDPPLARFGAGEAGMSYACVASTGHWSSFHNQAALPYNSTFSLGTSFESRFMMKELSSKTLTCVIPGETAAMSLMLNHYGNAQYAIINGGVGSGIILTDGLSLGVQVDLINERCEGFYKDHTSLTFEAGMLGQLTPHITFGFHVFNPLNHLNGLPSAIRTGLAWKPDNSIVAAVEAVKNSDEPLSLRCGFLWRLPQSVALEAGYSTAPSSFSFGAGFFSGRLCADAAFNFNSQTGITPSISLLWNPKGK